jgi:hypothetical protein
MVFWKQAPGAFPRQTDLGVYVGQQLGTLCDGRF